MCPRSTAADGEHGVLEHVSNFSKSDRGELGCKFPTKRPAYLQILCSFLSGTRLLNVSHVTEGLRESSVKPLRGPACFVKRASFSWTTNHGFNSPLPAYQLSEYYSRHRYTSASSSDKVP